MMSVDYLIIGQGIAGTLAAVELVRRRKSFVIFDSNESSTASKITSGLINPVTGRRFVKSWKHELLKQVAIQVYEHVTQLTNNTYYKPIHLHRVMMTKQSEDLWLERVSQPEYDNLLGQQFITSEFLKQSCQLGVTHSAARIDIDRMLNDMRQWLTERDLMVIYRLSLDDIQLQERTCQDYIFKHILDCSGSGRFLLNGLGLEDKLRINSGERMLVRLTNYHSRKIVKANYFAIPWKTDIFWIGSHNSWGNFPGEPTEEGRIRLTRFLDQWIDSDFEILDHSSAMRVTSSDRRPAVGTHPSFSNVHFINGLGTKGVSLAPYAVQQLLSHVEEGTPLDKQIDICRFL